MPAPTDKATRMKWGEEAHKRIHGTVPQTAQHFGTGVHIIYDVMREWRAENGIETQGQINARATNAKRMQSRIANASAAGKPAFPGRKPKANGHLVPVTDNGAIQAQVNELREQLAHTMDEVHTLQKILMVVGRTL